jgi:hypothetical protein
MRRRNVCFVIQSNLWKKKGKGKVFCAGPKLATTKTQCQEMAGFSSLSKRKSIGMLLHESWMIVENHGIRLSLIDVIVDVFFLRLRDLRRSRNHGILSPIASVPSNLMPHSFCCHHTKNWERNDLMRGFS